MTENGFYIIKNEFFDFANDPFLKNNKDGKRPFYFCIKKVYQNKEIYWMIPLSSKVEKFKKIIKKRIYLNKPTDGLYICKLPNDRESAFLIQDIFPITRDFVEREYTLGGNHLILVKEKDILEITKKANKIINIILRGVKLMSTSPNIPILLDKLLKNK